jgi:hypothetical protein
MVRPYYTETARVLMRFQRFNLFEQAGHVHRFGIEVIAACGDSPFPETQEGALYRPKGNILIGAKTNTRNHCRSAQPMSLMGQLHALPRRSIAVRFTPISRPRQDGLNATLCAMSRHMQRRKKLLMMSQRRLFCVGRIGKHRFHRSVYDSWQPNREG